MSTNEQPWYKRFWNWLCGKVKQWWKLSAPSVAQSVLDTLNDPELQATALACVKAVADGGFKGNRAFKKAFESFSETLKEQGKELHTNVKDTLIQNAYCVLKNSEE
ncbi:MAG: hypothetical protein Q4F99_02875 [bacterium]|nr:hypothetical protein [bacterium]